jgi:hypothetical protein
VDPKVRAGNTVYLVNVPGALLSFGDGHLGMGGGEIIRTAVEGAMNVGHRGTIKKRRRRRRPRSNAVDDVGRRLARSNPRGSPSRTWSPGCRKAGALRDGPWFVSQAASRSSDSDLFEVLVKIEKRRLPSATR